MGLFQAIKNARDEARENRRMRDKLVDELNETIDEFNKFVKKINMKMKTEQVNRSELKEGDVFTPVSYTGTYRVIEVQKKLLKTIALQPGNTYTSPDGYIYFGIMGGQDYKLDYKMNIVKSASLRMGDRVAPVAYPNDIMTVKHITIDDVLLGKISRFFF